MLLSKATLLELTMVDEIGVKIAESVLDFFAKEEKFGEY